MKNFTRLFIVAIMAMFMQSAFAGDSFDYYSFHVQGQAVPSGAGTVYLKATHGNAVTQTEGEYASTAEAAPVFDLFVTTYHDDNVDNIEATASDPAEGCTFVGLYMSETEKTMEELLALDESELIKEQTGGFTIMENKVSDTSEANAVAATWGNAEWAAAHAGVVRYIYAIYEGTPTAIKNISDANISDALYNLQGQRVTEATKGVLIRNGKKVVIK